MILLKGGYVVNSDRKYLADVLIENDTIKHIGVDLVPGNDVTVINTTNKLIIPGGIDPSTNFNFGLDSREVLKNDSRQALEGGTTTIINRLSSTKDSNLLNVLQMQCSQLKNQMFCNFGFYVNLDIGDENCHKHMKETVQNFGINCFEINIGSNVNKTIVSIMKECTELGCLLRVRAEDGAFRGMLEQNLIDAGVTGPEGFIQSRIIEDEIQSLYEVIKLNHLSQCAIFVPQVMNKEAATIVSHMKKNGLSIFGETITSALTVEADRYYLSSWDDAAAIITDPPFRNGQTSDLIRSLKNGDVDMLASQHTTVSVDDRSLGQKDFRKIPRGVSGVKERMSILWDRGVNTGIMDECEFVATTSTNAAKLFNLYPKRGFIGVGSIADIVVWDAEKIFKATSNRLKEVNIFDGITCHGAPHLVILNGVVKYQNDSVVEPLSGEKIDLKNNCRMILDKLKQHQQRQEVGKVVIEHDYNNVMHATENVGNQTGTNSGDNEGQKDTFGAKSQRPPTSGGNRNMQDSSFAFSGAQIDDDRPNRSSIRTNQPPGGKSSHIW